MDPVTLIVTALAAGTASALQDGTSTAVKDRYVRLRVAVRRRLAGRPEGELALARHKDALQTWQAPLTAELSEAGAGDDGDLTAAAHALIELLGTAGGQAGKCPIVVSSAQCVQVGDHNTQTNTFGCGTA